MFKTGGKMKRKTVKCGRKEEGKFNLTGWEEDLSYWINDVFLPFFEDNDKIWIV